MINAARREKRMCVFMILPRLRVDSVFQELLQTGE